jgi:hypothetical protein
MSLRAISQQLVTVPLIGPKAIVATTNGTALDLAAADTDMVVFNPGVWTDGTYTLKLQDSPDNVTWTDVTPANQVGTLAAISSAPTAVLQQVSYIGPARYLRPVVTASGATTGVLLDVFAVVKRKKQP